MTVKEERKLGWARLRNAFLVHSTKSVREQADIFLFMIGILVEYVLLTAVIVRYSVDVEAPMKVFNGVVLIGLFVALFIHQCLIFRNFSLHRSLSRGRYVRHELLICLLFGVLTGEVGYLYVLAKCSFPDTFLIRDILALSDGLLGPPPNQDGVVVWDFYALGRALKGVFALGAVLLSGSILLWDFRAAGSFRRKGERIKAEGNGASESSSNQKERRDQSIVAESYDRSVRFFYAMDIIACGVWLGVLGCVLPDGRLGMRGGSWASILNTFAFLYLAFAMTRIAIAVQTLGKLTDETEVERTVI
jgi:hypothetical protein